MQEVLDEKRLEQEKQEEKETEEVKESSSAVVVDPSKHGLGDKIYS